MDIFSMPNVRGCRTKFAKMRNTRRGHYFRTLGPIMQFFRKWVWLHISTFVENGGKYAVEVQRERIQIHCLI